MEFGGKREHEQSNNLEKQRSTWGRFGEPFWPVTRAYPFKSDNQTKTRQKRSRKTEKTKTPENNDDTRQEEISASGWGGARRKIWGSKFGPARAYLRRRLDAPRGGPRAKTQMGKTRGARHSRAGLPALVSRRSLQTASQAVDKLVERSSSDDLQTTGWGRRIYEGLAPSAAGPLLRHGLVQGLVCQK